MAVLPRSRLAARTAVFARGSTTIGAFNRPSSLFGYGMTFDADGNLTQRVKSGVFTLNFYWSSENHLDSLEYVGSVHTRYDYNAFGQPAIRYTKEAGHPWAVQSYYIWDGDQLLMELDSLGHRKSDYTYFPGTIDNPAFETIGATSITAVRDFQVDATGSVIGTRDGSHKSQTVWYGAFGGPTISGNYDNPLYWKGLFGDVDGPVFLQYVRNRWYDPTLGRFISEDPIGHDGGEKLYAFANNDPINGSDPSGLMQQSCTRYYIERIWLNSGNVEHLGSFDSCETLQSGGGGAAPSSVAPAPAPQKPLAKCVEASLNLFVTGVGDYLGATALRDGYVAAKIGLDFGSKYLELRLLRGAGALSKKKFTRYAIPLGAAADAAFGGAAGHLMEFSQGLSQSAQMNSVSDDVSLLDFIPGIATGRALAKAYRACMP